MSNYNRIDVDVEVIKALYCYEGKTIAEIAHELKCNPLLVASRIKEYKLKKKQKYDYITKELLERLYIKENKSIREVAEELGVEEGVIARRLKKYRIKIRPAGRKYSISKEILEDLFYNKRMSCQEISDLLGPSVSVIRRRFREFGIPLEGSHKRAGKETGALKDVTKEDLYELYITKNMSAKDVALRYNTSVSVVRTKLNFFNIKREFKVQCTEEDLYELYIEKNFTIKQVSKIVGVSDSVISKKLKEYGIRKDTKWDKISKEELENLYLRENLFIEEIAERLGYPRYVVNYYLKVYELKDRKTKEQEEECQLRRIERSLAGCNERSSHEIELEERYPTFFRNTFKTIGAELDLLYPKEKVAIEVNGVYWHGTLEHSKDDIRHIQKLIKCQKEGIQLINVFDYFLRSKKNKSKIINLLDNLLNPEILRLPAGVINIVNSKEQKIFEEENNLNGHEHKTNFCLGTYNQEGKILNTVSGITYDKTTEIQRFTTRVGYLEDYSQLIEAIKEHYNPKNIIVTCDKQFYNGSLFTRLGFEVMEEVSPDYFFVYNQRIVSRTTYNKNPDKYKKYYKVYDCGRVRLRLDL